MQDTNKTIVTLAVTGAAAVILYGVLTISDQRTISERIGDAIHELPQGADRAGRELESVLLVRS